MTLRALQSSEVLEGKRGDAHRSTFRASNLPFGPARRAARAFGMPIRVLGMPIGLVDEVMTVTVMAVDLLERPSAHSVVSRRRRQRKGEGEQGVSPLPGSGDNYAGGWNRRTVISAMTCERCATCGAT